MLFHRDNVMRICFISTFSYYSYFCIALNDKRKRRMLHIKCLRDPSHAIPSFNTPPEKEIPFAARSSAW